MVDGGDALGGEQFGEQPHHHLAVFQHVADAARRTQVVLQHVESAVAVAHQVDPGDVRVDVAMQVEPVHDLLIAVVGQHLLRRDDAGLEDALIVIDVGEEQVQCLDPLDAPSLDPAPFADGDAARDDVEGDQTLGALRVAVQGEGDARPVKQKIGLAPALGQQLLGSVLQPVGEAPVMRPADAVRIVHFVKKLAIHACSSAVHRRNSQSSCQLPSSYSYQCVGDASRPLPTDRKRTGGWFATRSSRCPVATDRIRTPRCASKFLSCGQGAAGSGRSMHQKSSRFIQQDPPRTKKMQHPA